MRDQTEAELTDREAEAADRYGEVALGVECAWPLNLPLNSPVWQSAPATSDSVS